MKELFFTFIGQQLLLAFVLACGIFLIGLIFEKPISAFLEKKKEEYRKKELEKRKREYLALKQQKEADKRKVQKIRDNYNREMENTGKVYLPYYMAS